MGIVRDNDRIGTKCSLQVSLRKTVLFVCGDCIARRWNS